MTGHWLLASLHLLAVSAAFAAIAARALLLRAPLGPARLRSVFAADNLWGLTAIALLATGLWRLFGETDKGTGYYMGNDAFWVKMALLAVILALEVWPAVTLIRWRMGLARGRELELGAAPAIRRISILQAHLLAGMLFAATAMARGIFY